MHELTNNKGYNSKRNNTDCTYEWALAHDTPVFTLHYLSTGNDHTHSRKYIYIYIYILEIEKFKTVYAQLNV
jgi:hypothetical protein